MKEYIVETNGFTKNGKFIVADRVKIIKKGELIRCKDCKYWDGYYCHNKSWGDGYGNYTPPIKREDGYCDWAERKEE